MQAVEHTAVLHSVTVEGHVVTGLVDIALLTGIDGTLGGVVLVVVPVQVVVGIVRRGLHNGVIQNGSLNAQPAHKIRVGVLLVEGLVVPAPLNVGLLGLGGSLGGCFRGGLGSRLGGSRGGHGVLPQLIIELFVLLRRPEVGEQINGAAQKRDGQNDYKGYVDAFLFHGVSSCH